MYIKGSMEILIFGALAYAGSEFASVKRSVETIPNSTPNSSIQKLTRRPNSIPDVRTPNSSNSQAINKPFGRIETDEFKKEVHKHLNNPNTILSNQHGLVPFFRSEKSQNTNDDVKDRRLATFTGVDLVEYEHKKEVNAPAPVKGFTNINGTTFDPDVKRYKDFMISDKQTNTKPFESKLVGKGLGLNPECKAAGGFHQHYRVLPGNVNGYRKHNYQGTLIHGKSKIDNRAVDPHIDVNSRTNQPSLHYRGLDVKQSSVKSQTPRPSTIINENNRSLSSDVDAWSLQLENSGVHGPNQTYSTNTYTRDGKHVYDSPCAYGNPNGSSSGLGGYHNASFMDIHTERGDENCQQVNVASQHMGGYTKWNHSDIQTQRETCNDGLLTSSIADAYNNSSVVRDGFSAKPTHKETFNKCPISYIGGANHTNSFGHNSSNLQHNYVRPTSRSVSQCSKTLGGPAMSSIPTNTSYKQTYEGSRGYTSRENTLVSDYTPIKTSNNAMINTSGFENSTRYREDNNIQNIASNASVNSVNNFKSLSSVGNYGTRDRSGVENKRDFGFAPGLNANNPYALDINRK